MMHDQAEYRVETIGSPTSMGDSFTREEADTLAWCKSCERSTVYWVRHQYEYLPEVIYFCGYQYDSSPLPPREYHGEDSDELLDAMRQSHER
jgi:hypothetical protein